MKKILFFETPEFTGATRVTRILAKSISTQYAVGFAVVAPGSGAKVNILKVTLEEKPDILFSSFISLNPDVIDVGKSLGLTVVIRNDYRLTDVPDNIKQRAAETYPLADQIIAQTASLRQELLESFNLNPSKVIVKANPIDKEGITEKLRNAANPYPDNGCKHFVWVGRFAPIKRLDTLLEAFAIVHQLIPQTELYLVGKPDDVSKYRQEGINLIGFQNNPYPWIKYADCLLLSSISEANPNVIQEAIYLNTPVISTPYNADIKQTENHLISASHASKDLAVQIFNFLKQ